MHAKAAQPRFRNPQEGDVLAIPLEDGTFGFAQVCVGRDYAFFDLRRNEPPPIDQIVEHAIAFRVPVAKGTAKQGGWTIIGNRTLVGERAEAATYCNRPVGSTQFRTYRAGGFSPAAYEEVKDLEVFAWWFGEQIVRRLLDHFEGRPNRDLETIRRSVGL